LKRVLIVIAGVLVLIVGGGVAFALRDGEAPPPPRLEGNAVVPAGEQWRVGEGSFAGYRVDEEYLGVGVNTAVGRTRAVFKDFAIEPPSVAGLVTVRDTGMLEFRLVATAG